MRHWSLDRGNHLGVKLIDQYWVKVIEITFVRAENEFIGRCQARKYDSWSIVIKLFGYWQLH